MKKVDWNEDLINWAEEFLSASRSVREALDVLSQRLGIEITTDMLANAFKRRGMLPPSTYLRQESDDDSEPSAESYRVKYPRGTAPKYRVSVKDSGPIKKDSGYLICVSDAHYPIQDKWIEEGTVALARDLADDDDLTVVFNGDMLDNWMASRFDKEPARFKDPSSTLQGELDELCPYLHAMSDTAQHVHYGMGNHEWRLEKLVAANPVLFDLRSIEWRTLLECEDRDNVSLYDYGYRIHIGPVTFLHGDPNGAKNAAAMLRKYPRLNTIFGHTHGASTAHDTDYDYMGREISTFSINSGHCSDTVKQDYVNKPNWQKSFVVIHYMTHRGEVTVTPQLVLVRDDRFSYNGKFYGRGTCK